MMDFDFVLEVRISNIVIVDKTHLLSVPQPRYDGRRITSGSALELQLVPLDHVGVLRELLDLRRGLHHDLDLLAGGHPVHVLGLAPVVGLVLLLNALKVERPVVQDLVVMAQPGQLASPVRVPGDGGRRVTLSQAVQHHLQA